MEVYSFVSTDFDPCPTVEDMKKWRNALSKDTIDDLHLRIELMTYDEVMDWKARAVKNKDLDQFLQAMFVAVNKAESDKEAVIGPIPVGLASLPDDDISDGKALIDWVLEDHSKAFSPPITADEFMDHLTKDRTNEELNRMEARAAIVARNDTGLITALRELRKATERNDRMVAMDTLAVMSMATRIKIGPEIAMIELARLMTSFTKG
jgi:hypothetical protein